jgi:hypothetical protein
MVNYVRVRLPPSLYCPRGKLPRKKRAPSLIAVGKEGKEEETETETKNERGKYVVCIVCK